nr:M23 family metallopeptidase [Deltaproteobacteria bacterium]
MVPLLLFALVPSLQAPWPCNDSFVVSQSNGGAVSHQGVEQFAWDFDLDEGDPVLAAAGGTVIHLRTDSTVGGCDPSFGNDANYVVIDHGDGSAGLYLHMSPHSSPLAVGDTVETGDLIGRVGLTGWVCGDHLHFQVQQICGSWYCQSVSASFAGQGVPGLFEAVQSNNCPSCDADLDG